MELTQGGTLKAKSVIVATGGVSYPTTGSTGDGYQFARENGLNVTKLSASLVGMTMDEKWPMLLQGLSLKNVRITAKTGKKTIYSELGEMLFTHFGVSGPLIIELSSHMPEDFSRVNVMLDMKPGLTEEPVSYTHLDVYKRQVERRVSLQSIRKLVDQSLKGREATVIRMRYGLMDGKTYAQQEVAQKLGVSRSYISRIEKKALERLRVAFETGK